MLHCALSPAHLNPLPAGTLCRRARLIQPCFGGIERDDSGRQRSRRRICEAISFDQITHRTATGKVFDRSRKILIRPLVAGQDCANWRQNMMQVKTISRPNRRTLRQGKIEHEEVPASCQNATHFPQCSRPVPHVAQTKGDCDGVE